jgi:PKD repeat protein
MLLILQTNILSATEESFPTDRPFLFIDPQKTIGATGDVFTINLKIFNLTANWAQDPNNPMTQRPLGNLYALDIKLVWDPAVLEYVSHNVTIPVENYTEGVLHEPITILRDKVNQTEGSYRLICYSSSPALPFNNEGQISTIFNMTFRVKLEEGTSIELVPVSPANTPEEPAKLSDVNAYLILYYYRGATFEPAEAPQASFTYWPSDGYAVANKTVIFNGSESQPSGRIVGYKWNFGDGNVTDWLPDPIVYHSFAQIGIYYVKLQVKDDAGRISSWTTPKLINVILSRGIEALFFSFQTEKILWGDTLAFNVTVENEGDASESFIISTYYNSTPTGGWNLIEEKSETLEKGRSKIVSFSWNTSLIPLEHAYYNILANLTAVPHEENIENNEITSFEKQGILIELLTEPYHDVEVFNLEAVSFSVTREYTPPIILGEEMKIRFTVKAKGTYDETFNGTLQILLSNGTLLESKEWQNVSLNKYGTLSLEFSITALIVDDLNVTVNITLVEDKYPDDNFAFRLVKVIDVPVLQIDFSPSKIYVGDVVTFDATGTHHPSGTISSYVWEIKKAGEPDELYGNKKTGATVTYTFDNPGNWTVRLKIVDNWGISYDATRPATNSYKLEVTITVSAPQTPYEIYALIIVVAIAVVGIAYWRFRKPK